MKTFMYTCKTSLPTNIDGITGVNDITKLWQEHYRESNTVVVGEIHDNENVTVSLQEIFHEGMSLEVNKACGTDKITAEHLKYASR